ncbi:MAG: J domain-containing protein [Pseudomonadota bacterium]
MATPSSLSPVTPTYYDVLRVERGASADGIRRAYRKLAQTYHPDKMPGNANAARAMAAINAAYEVLADSERRAEHDRWIDRVQSPAPRRPARAEPADDWAFLHPATGWPWYLLFATILFALGTVAAALYLTAFPLRM